MTHRWARWVFAGIRVLALAAVLSPAVASAKTGIALVSDWHAYAGNLEDLVRQIAYERARLLAEDPDAELIVDFNGDNAGMSAYTYYLQDHGDLVYDYYRVLARSPRTRIVVGMGNHDAFDFEGPRGNALFYRQTHALQRDLREITADPFFVVNANLHLTEIGRTLVRPYQDVMTSAGKVRFVGFVLDEFFKKCGYSRTEGISLFDGLTPAMEMVDAVFDQAVKDGVNVLVPMVHDYAKQVVHLKRAFDRRNQGLPAARRIRIPWALAAHDHIQTVNFGDGVLDAGSNGGMVFTVLENDGAAGYTHAYASTPPGGSLRSGAPWMTDRHLSAAELEFLKRARPRIEPIRKELSRVVGYAPAALGRKETVKRSANASGVLMGEALRLWADEETHRTEGTTRITGPAVAFYNSSSYRYDYDIPEGAPITNEMLFGFYPLEGLPPGDGLIFGSTLLDLYRTARIERMARDSTHTPQLSANLREVGSPESPSLEWWDARRRRWKPVRRTDRFPFAVDGFLAHDGYEIPGWKKLLAEVHWFAHTTPPRQRDIIFRQVPRLLRPTPAGQPEIPTVQDDSCVPQIVEMGLTRFPLPLAM